MEEKNDQGSPDTLQDGQVVDSPQTEETPQEPQEEEQPDFEAKIKELEGTVADLTGKLKRATKPKSEPKKESSNINKESGELDWGQKAFLRTEGIESNEFDFVQEQLADSNLPLEKLLGNNYFKSQLQEFRDQKSAEKASPGNTRGSTKSTQAQPEYWVDRPFNEVPVELRRQVLALKEQKEKGPSHRPHNIVYGNS